MEREWCSSGAIALLAILNLCRPSDVQDDLAENGASSYTHETFDRADRAVGGISSR